MTEAERFLDLAAIELMRTEGLQLVKAPGNQVGMSPSYVPAPAWDMVLASEGMVGGPALYCFASGDGLSFDEIKSRYEAFAAQAVQGYRPPSGSGAPLRLVVTYVFSTVDARVGRRVARLVPREYYSGLRPQVWVVDLASGRMYTPRRLQLWPTRAQSAMRRALTELRAGANATPADLAAVEAEVTRQRSVFAQTLRRNQPYVTYALLAAIWFVFALEYEYPGGDTAVSTLLHFGALQPRLIQQGQWWRFFTAMFVHVGFVHIFFNSIALYSVGVIVERIYGSVRYAVIYFVSGILASVASYVFLASSGQMNEVAAGASGAIFGIAGVLIVLGLLRRSVVPRAVALQLSLFMLVLIVVNIVFDAFSPNIDIRAHVGGLLVGAILGYVLAPRSVEPAVSYEP